MAVTFKATKPGTFKIYDPLFPAARVGTLVVE